MPVESVTMTWSEIRGLTHYIFYDHTLFRIKEVGITLNHLFVAAVILAASFIFSRWVRGLLSRRFLKRFQLDSGVEFAFLRVVHYCVVLVGTYVSLSTLNIPLGALGGFLALLGVGIGFGMQNLAANFISGVILLFERPVKIGDRITVEDIWGDVTQINLRTTVVTTVDNISMIIPNSKLLENNLINWSYGDKKVRISVPVGVAYGSDVELISDLLLCAAREDPEVLGDPASLALMTEFGESSLNFVLSVWIPDSTLKPFVTDRLNRAIDRLFRQHGIEIPFPQRDLHLRTATAPLCGPKG